MILIKNVLVQQNGEESHVFRPRRSLLKKSIEKRLLFLTRFLLLKM